MIALYYTISIVVLHTFFIENCTVCVEQCIKLTVQHNRI